MPLLDHFHQPVDIRRNWESFHSRWANSIGDALNRILPRRFVTLINVHLGSYLAADVAEFEQSAASAEDPSGNGSGGRTATAVQPWTPPASAISAPVSFPDEFEVQVIEEPEGARLVGVIELVSPHNKDRPQTREAFAAKCMNYLQHGVGVIVADIVTARQANLHNKLLTMLEVGEVLRMPADRHIYAAAYRPVRRNDENVIEMWPTPLQVGATLPVLPLALRGWQMVPVDLEATYADACQRSRL